VTFLAIAETLQGDMTGYIPSNLSSMCDGQVCMSTSLFAEGFRPAIDFGLSLSIIGGKVQPPILRSLGQSLRADFARYSEIIRLSKLQTGLSGDAERIVRKGGAMLVVLQQGAYRPVPLVAQVLALYGLQRDWLSSQTTAVQSRFRDEIHAFALDRNPRLLQEIQETMTLTPEVDAGLADLMKAFFGGQEKG
jgi:F-type H+-transporting ATPase subunit alpha